ncbi:glutamate racemase [Roseobacter sp. HKCCA0434]|uniref:glutamate racemase n=1 Tax=Roseobacter sp. HKCCA0434 TaxID=3079297 RepID=UPI002905A46C|nr:aspartate/glutamate racemase family protein [Roseobacter sp. HKCCA0434]
MIGVFDSGHGGLTTLAALQARLPAQQFVYLGDHANAPYGPRTRGEIVELTRAALDRLFRRGCTLVVIACNTAAAVALRDLQQGWLAEAWPDRRALGVFVPVIEALSGRDWADDSPPDDLTGTRIALFATQATVDSGAFAREMRFRARGMEIVQVACPGLVDLLEAGRMEEARALAGGFADTVSEFAPSRAFLGCTHYPLVADAFTTSLGPEVEIISQPDCVADSLFDYLGRHPAHRAAGGTEYLTTGDPGKVRAAAYTLTGRDLAFSKL